MVQPKAHKLYKANLELRKLLSNWQQRTAPPEPTTKDELSSILNMNEEIHRLWMLASNDIENDAARYYTRFSQDTGLYTGERAKRPPNEEVNSFRYQ